jgi:hypothetical protein
MEGRGFGERGRGWVERKVGIKGESVVELKEGGQGSRERGGRKYGAMERRVQLIRWGCKGGGNKVEVPVKEKCMKLRARRKGFWDMKDAELNGRKEYRKGRGARKTRIKNKLSSAQCSELKYEMLLPLFHHDLLYSDNWKRSPGPITY